MGSLNIYAAATRNPEEGLPIISSYIDTLHCKNTWSESICEQGLRDFRSIVSYVRLKSDADYHHLQNVMSNSNETLRIFYLSVSPSLYEGLATLIDEQTRPPSNTPLRVVFEKPFGKVRGIVMSHVCILYSFRIMVFLDESMCVMSLHVRLIILMCTGFRISSFALQQVDCPLVRE